MRTTGRRASSRQGDRPQVETGELRVQLQRGEEDPLYLVRDVAAHQPLQVRPVALAAGGGPAPQEGEVLLLGERGDLGADGLEDLSSSQLGDEQSEEGVTRGFRPAAAGIGARTGAPHDEPVALEPVQRLGDRRARNRVGGGQLHLRGQPLALPVAPFHQGGPQLGVDAEVLGPAFLLGGPAHPLLPIRPRSTRQLIYICPEMSIAFWPPERSSAAGKPGIGGWFLTKVPKIVGSKQRIAYCLRSRFADAVLAFGPS